MSGPPGHKILMTRRLWVRRWHLVEDRPALVALFGDPDVVKFIGNRPLADVDAAGPFLDKRLARPAGPGQGFWAVVHRQSGAVIGSANLDPTPLDAERVSHDVQYGVSLRPDWWGKGLATELGAGVLSYADALGLNEVVAVVEPGNDRSHAMIERLGFTREGPTTDYYGGETLVRYRRARGTDLPTLTLSPRPHHRRRA